YLLVGPDGRPWRLGHQACSEVRGAADAGELMPLGAAVEAGIPHVAGDPGAEAHLPEAALLQLEREIERAIVVVLVRDRRAEMDERGDAEIARINAGEGAAVELRQL